VRGREGRPGRGRRRRRRRRKAPSVASIASPSRVALSIILFAVLKVEPCVVTDELEDKELSLVEHVRGEFSPSYTGLDLSILKQRKPSEKA